MTSGGKGQYNMSLITNSGHDAMPNGYNQWRLDIEALISLSKLRAAINVNTEMLTLYWNIGKQIIERLGETNHHSTIKRPMLQISRRQGIFGAQPQEHETICGRIPQLSNLASATCQIERDAHCASYTRPIKRRKEGLFASVAYANIMVSPHLTISQSKRRSRASLLHHRDCPKRMES